MVNSFGKLKLTKEEEEDIVLENVSSSGIFEECSLSLFGRLLSDRHQNLRALKNTLKAAWKMGSDLRIVEVGNNVLQFKFGSRCQLEWVEKSGPWNFENNLLLLCRWRKGLTSTNICFSYAPFWVQIWGLPFENMSEEIGKNIGSKIGSDKRALQADQAKFLRVRMELQIDKPLRRGGYIKNDEGERIWVDFRYERLPTFCFRCGILGHDEKHCQANSLELCSDKQYGEWMKAGGALRVGSKKEKLKEHPVADKGSSVPRVFNGRDGGESMVGSSRCNPEQVVGRGVGEEYGSEMMVEAAPLTTGKSSVMSSHGEQGMQVSGMERVPEASVSELEGAARERLNETRNSLVRNEWYETVAGQQAASKDFGPGLDENEEMSPSRMNVAEGLSERIKDGPVLCEEGKIIPSRKTGNMGLSGEIRGVLALKEADGFEPVRQEGGKGSSSVEQTQPFRPNRVIKQGVKGKMKKIAREKGKFQEVVQSEQNQEVCKKRKLHDEIFSNSDNNVQKRLCEGEKGGSINLFAETAVTAKQHRLDQ